MQLNVSTNIRIRAYEELVADRSPKPTVSMIFTPQ